MGASINVPIFVAAAKPTHVRNTTSHYARKKVERKVQKTEDRIMDNLVVEDDPNATEDEADGTENESSSSASEDRPDIIMEDNNSEDEDSSDDDNDADADMTMAVDGSEVYGGGNFDVRFFSLFELLAEVKRMKDAGESRWLEWYQFQLANQERIAIDAMMMMEAGADFYTWSQQWLS